jgi:hypothetical protein
MQRKVCLQRLNNFCFCCTARLIQMDHPKKGRSFKPTNQRDKQINASLRDHLLWRDFSTDTPTKFEELRNNLLRKSPHVPRKNNPGILGGSSPNDGRLVSGRVIWKCIACSLSPSQQLALLSVDRTRMESIAAGENPLADLTWFKGLKAESRDLV